MKPIYKALDLPIEGQVVCEPIAAYKKVRQANKGFRTSYLRALTLMHYNKGVKCAELGYSLDITTQGAYIHLGLLIAAGYVVKRDKTYYCTDLGHKIVLDALEAGKELIANVTASVVKKATTEISKRLKRG